MELKDNRLIADVLDDLDDDYKTLMEWLVTINVNINSVLYYYTGLVNVHMLKLLLIF